MPSPAPGDPGLARETQLQREAEEWSPPTKVEDIPLAAEEDIPVIDVGRYLEAFNGKVKQCCQLAIARFLDHTYVFGP